MSHDSVNTVDVACSNCIDTTHMHSYIRKVGRIMKRRQPIAKKGRKQGKCGLEKNNRYAEGGINVRGGKMGVSYPTSLTLPRSQSVPHHLTHSESLETEKRTWQEEGERESG